MKLDIPGRKWLLRQLSAVSRRGLSHAELELLSQQYSGAGDDTQIDEWLLAVFTRLGLGAPRWSTVIDASNLPALAIVPGLGIRLVYRAGAAGAWKIQGPEGEALLHGWPEGSRFAALPTIAAHDEAQPPKTMRQLMREIFFADRHWLRFAALVTVLCNLLALGVSLYSMQVYDRVIPTQGVSTLIVLTIGAGFALILDLMLKFARSAIVNKALRKIDMQLSHHVFDCLLSLRLDQLPAEAGSLPGQLRGHETMRGFISAITLYLMADAPFALLFLVVIFMLGGPTLAAVPLVFVALSLITGLTIRWHIEAAAKAGTNTGHRKMGLLMEVVNGAEAIKANGAGWQAQGQWNSLTRESIGQEVVIRHLSESASYIGAALQQAAYVALVAVGAYVATKNAGLTTGALVACAILSGRVLAPIGMIPGLLVQWAHARAAQTSLEAVFALQRDNHAVSQPLIPDVMVGRYCLRDVAFAYAPEVAPVSIPRLDIAAGEKVALLGTVGAGKSTLLRMLAGLYRPQQGRVLFDDLDIQQISRSRLSDAVGYLPQQATLFRGSLRDNLTAGLIGLSDGQILEAAKATGLLPVISGHPRGLSMDIFDGGHGLSGGQKQLVVLTRLLLAAPSVWLLDEPTGSMDSATESRCLQAMKAAMAKEHTAIIVTHKPALLALVERIIVMTPAGIILDGPRDTVIAQLERGVQIPALHPVATATASSVVSLVSHHD